MRNYLTIFAVFVLWAALAEAADEMSEIRITPESDETLSIGSDYSLTCNFVAEVVSNVKWIGPDGIELVNDPPKISIEKEDTLQILTLNEISEADTGTYHCEGFSSSANTTIRESRQISVFEPVRIVDTPEVQIFEVGTDATVLCSARGTPEPTIIWWFGTDKIETVSNEKFTTIEGSSNLIIKNISKEEEGVYTCNARELTVRGQNIKEQIQVFAYVPPQILNFEEDAMLTATEGSTTVLMCEASGDPTPDYSWYNGDGSTLDETTFLLNGSDLELSIDRQMSGKSFACVASNQIGMDVASVMLAVTVKPYFTIERGDQVLEKNPATLSCVAEGVPLPKVEIYRDDILLPATEAVVSDFNSTTDYNATSGAGVWSTNREVTYDVGSAFVKFSYVDYTDSGKYECRAVNEAGHETTDLYLEVEYAPKSTILNNVWACEGTLATLECQFHANPPADLSWGLYSTDVVANVTSFMEYNVSDTPEGVFISQVNDILALTIDTAIVPDPWTTYHCIARNTIGTNNASVVLNKAEAPVAPIGVQISEVGTRKATVSFTPLQSLVDNEYFKITLAPASPDSPEVVRRIDAQMSEYTFDELEHDMTYTVIVEAVNCADTSPPSEVKEFKTKAIETPEAVEIISGESSENHDKYLVKWEPKGLGGGEVSKIMVTVSRVTEEIDGLNVTKVDEILLRPGDQEFENRSLVIEDLNPSSKYEISVDIYNEVGSATSKRMFNTAMEPETSTTPDDSGPDFALGRVDWKLILIIIAVLLLLVILIDVICFFTRSWGITMWIYAKTCGKSKKHKVEDAEEGSAQFSKETEGQFKQQEVEVDEGNAGAVGVEEEKQPIANEAEPVANGDPALGKLAPIDEQTPLRNGNDEPDPTPTPSGNGTAEGAQEPAEEKVEKTKSPEEEKLVKSEENEA